MRNLTAGSAAVSVDLDRGGRLASLVVHGHELLVQPAGGSIDPTHWGCFPMVPFAGRIRHGRFTWNGTPYQLATHHGAHAMHGTLDDAPWLDEGGDDHRLRLRGALGPGWPFEGWAIQEVELLPDRLHLRMEVHTAGEPFPATCGWHPWFNRRLAAGAALDVDLRAGLFYPRAADGVPLGRVDAPPPRGPWDDCFTAVTWPVRLSWPGALEAELTSTCDHVVLFDQPEHAICVEPQSGPPDAPNLGLAHTVTVDDPLVVDAQLTWHLP